jgi:hypothetical protein
MIAPLGLFLGFFMPVVSGTGEVSGSRLLAGD